MTFARGISHNPPELARLGDCCLKGFRSKLADLRRRDSRLFPASRENEIRAIGPLPIRQQEVRPRPGDNYLFAVELDLDVHDGDLSQKRSPGAGGHRGSEAWDTMLLGFARPAG
jgi:hypothetical protein